MSERKLSDWSQRLVEDGELTEAEARQFERTVKANYQPFPKLMSLILQNISAQPLDKMVIRAESETLDAGMSLEQMQRLEEPGYKRVRELLLRLTVRRNPKAILGF